MQVNQLIYSWKNLHLGHISVAWFDWFEHRTHFPVKFTTRSLKLCSSKRAELICELTDSPALTQIFLKIIFTRFKPHLVFLLKSLDFPGERSELKSACKEAFSCWLSRVFSLFEHLCMFVSHAWINKWGTLRSFGCISSQTSFSRQWQCQQMAPHLSSIPAAAGALPASSSSCSTVPPSTPPTSWHLQSMRLPRKVHKGIHLQEISGYECGLHVSIYHLLLQITESAWSCCCPVELRLIWSCLMLGRRSTLPAWHGPQPA